MRIVFNKEGTKTEKEEKDGERECTKNISDIVKSKYLKGIET